MRLRPRRLDRTVKEKVQMLRIEWDSTGISPEREKKKERSSLRFTFANFVFFLCVCVCVSFFFLLIFKTTNS